jgi:hypothetical protein
MFLQLFPSALRGTDKPMVAPLQEQAQVANGANVPQLVRVDDRSHGLDLSAGDLERQHADQLPSAVEHERARLAVHLTSQVVRAPRALPQCSARPLR